MTKRVVDVYPSGLSKRLTGISHWNNPGLILSNGKSVSAERMKRDQTEQQKV